MPRDKTISRQMREHSHAAILNAARKLFAEYGYFQTKIADIARQAGMSQGNIYWYFSSKEELLKAVLLDGFESIQRILVVADQMDGAAIDKVDRLLVDYIAFGREGGEFITILVSLLGHGGDAFFEKLGLHMREIGFGYHQSLENILTQGQAEGTLDKSVDPSVLAMFFFGFFNGLFITYGKDWLAIPEEAIRDAVFQMLGGQSSYGAVG